MKVKKSKIEIQLEKRLANLEDQCYEISERLAFVRGDEFIEYFVAEHNNLGWRWYTVSDLYTKFCDIDGFEQYSPYQFNKWMKRSPLFYRDRDCKSVKYRRKE